MLPWKIKGRIDVRIIKSMGSTSKLKEEGNISDKFSEHLEAKVERLKEILEPEQNIEAFSLDR